MFVTLSVKAMSAARDGHSVETVNVKRSRPPYSISETGSVYGQRAAGVVVAGGAVVVARAVVVGVVSDAPTPSPSPSRVVEEDFPLPPPHAPLSARTAAPSTASIRFKPAS